MVNAPVIARERDIDVEEVKHERDSDYQTLIRVTVETERQSRDVAGTLFGGSRPRLVEIKGISMEAQLSSHMLYIANRDRPGVIGGLGNICARHDINIASFHLGRAELGGDAIALLEIDQPMDAGGLAEVRALPQVTQATPLQF